MLKTVMVTIINFLKIALVYVLFSGAFIYGMSWLHDHGCLLRDAKPNSVGLTAQIEAQIEALRKAGCPLMRKYPAMRHAAPYALSNTRADPLTLLVIFWGEGD